MGKVVCGEGPQNAKMVFIGEAPGATEEAQGRPFVGSAGDVLNQLLADCGIDRELVYIDNVMQVRPSNNDFSVFYEGGGREHPTPELCAGIERLHATLRQLSPDVIVCLGAEAMKAITGDKGIDSHRGYPKRAFDCNVIVTHHPAKILREWKLYPTAQFDISKAKQIAERFGKGSPCPKVEPTFIPSYNQCLEYLERLQQLDPTYMLAFDIETSNGGIDCIGFCVVGEEPVCIRFASDDDEDGCCWALGQELALWNAVRKVLEGSLPKVVQNGHYDSYILYTVYNIMPNNIVLDTMIAFALMYPGQPKGLGHLATMYTMHPFWKDIPKKLGPSRWLYNALDCRVTADIAIPVLNDLRDNGCYEFYYRIPHRLFYPLLDMSIRGIRVDQPFRNKTRELYRKRIKRLKSAIRALIPPEATQQTLSGIKSVAEAVKRRDRALERIESKPNTKTAVKAMATLKAFESSEKLRFNPDSDTQLKTLLYSVMGFKAIKEKDFATGKLRVKVDESALRKLNEISKGKHSRLFGYLLQYNRLSKLYNTYLEAEVGSDGRLRCSYNIAGTVTGRLSSSAAHDGTGTNMQNIPKGDMRRMLCADEGYMLIQGDLKQAENRCVAYLAREPKMIAAFESGADIHKRIAAMIFRKSESEVSKRERQLGKKVGHATNYGMGVRRLIQVCWEELQIKLNQVEAKRLQNQYFDAFPRVRMWQMEIEQELKRTRTLTNPLGRKRYFFERYGPELFKEAYAYVPQSTIVDILNLGLINLYNAGYDLMLQVHDAVVLNGFTGQLEAINKLLEIPVRINGYDVIIPLEFSGGPNWEDVEEIEYGQTKPV